VACATPAVHADTLVKIGVAGPLTGSQAASGKDNERGARLAIDDLNAKHMTLGGQPLRFELISVDDESDPKAGVTAAQKLVDSGVIAVIGHWNSGVTIPASKIYNDARVIMITPAASNPALTVPGYPYVFRLTTDDNVDEAGADLLDAIAFVRKRAAEFHADPDRICVGFYSAGGVVSGVLLREAPGYLKCVVLYYPYLDLEHLKNKTIFREAHSAAHVDSLANYSPRGAIGRPAASLPPILLARAGRDEIPHLNESVDRFVATALERNVGLDFYTHPTGVHGFDLLTRDARTREIIGQTLSFLARHLQP